MANNSEVNTSSSRGRVYKTAGMVIIILFTFYLVLYLKENNFTYITYFSNYDNAIDVWNEGFDFFREIMNTIDTVTSALGKIFNFIVDSVETVITFFEDKIQDFRETPYGSTWFQWLKNWAYDSIRNLFF
jgi:hypothetical protein